MRYRRFGNSDLVVSEVGFGTWTLVTDWWGRTDDPHDMITRRARRRASTSSTPRRSTASDGAGETILARRTSPAATTSCSRRSVGYDITAERKFPGQSERPHDWRPESVRQQCEDSLRRLGTDHIDLYQLHNTRIEPILDDDLWDDARSTSAPKARCASSASRSGPRSAGSRKATASIDDRPIVSLQTVFNVLEQEPGLTFAARPRVQDGEVGADRARAARVRHALGQGHARHRVRPEGPPRAPQPRQHARQLREGRDALVPLGAGDRPHDRPGRDRGHPRQPRVHHACCRRVLSVDDVREYAAASDLPLTDDGVRRRRRACGRATSTTTTAT